MRRTSAVVIAAVLTGATACSGMLGSRAPLPPPVPSQTWSADFGLVDLPLAPATAPVERWRVALAPGGTARVQGSVIATAEPGKVETAEPTTVRRLDPKTGATMWTAQAPPGSIAALQIVGPDSAPAVAVAVAVPGRELALTVIDGADARPLWDGEADAPLPIVSATAEMLIVDTPRGQVGIDRASTEERWRTRRDVRLQDGALLVEEPKHSTFGVLDLATGEPLWEHTGEPFGDASVVGDLVVVTRKEEGARDSAMAYDTTTGEPRWTAPASLPRVGRSSVAASGADALILEGGESGGNTAVLDRATGAVRWEGEHVVTDVLTVGGVPTPLEVGENNITVLDATTGADLVTVPMRGYERFTVAGGAVYGADGDDVVARGLPDLEERWRVPGAAGPDGTSFSPVTGGFVTIGTADVVAYMP
ncbi:outer membrane protein assembly factor BamB family protein [Pseudonocardia sp. TRM90224]|uniref:outer membrane protein assembly factor BamB family protein n=1 Tax=Pseudonocardia sp. TRM90224 TaxID=2812678 RepID=UPI001E3934CE|nr:PQQ-binding-like beta-propeller repeat protein [Pseudonocardia sp. TRM90224]